ADRGDHGNCGSGDGAGKALAVEGGEIFGRASAAGDDNHLNAAELIEQTDASGYFKRGGVALDLGGEDQQVYRTMAALQDVENVAQGGTLRRGDDADAGRQRRDRSV